MTGVHENSLQAYREIEPKLSARQRAVMLWVHGFVTPVTRKHLALSMGLPINCVVPRVLELIKKGYLEECGTIIEDGYRASLVRVKPAQKEMFS